MKNIKTFENFNSDSNETVNESVFEVEGYWKDDKSEFSGLINEFDDVPEGMDESDFEYFGMSEDDIIQAIDDGEDNGVLDFVITGYKPI